MSNVSTCSSNLPRSTRRILHMATIVTRNIDPTMWFFIQPMYTLMLLLLGFTSSCSGTCSGRQATMMIRILWASVLALATASFVSATITVSNLLVENKQTPLGIDVPPRFSWLITSETRNTSQTSYQILLSATKAGSSDVWNSGVVSSNKPFIQTYTGPQLSSNTQYFWSVNVVSSSGSASASSEFTTGFFNVSDWDGSSWITNVASNGTLPDSVISAFQAASWIWTPEAAPPNAPAADRAFRKTITTPSGKTAISATILITADDGFTLYVNGALLGSSPNTTDIWKSAQQFFNVALSPTSNLFAVRAINRPDVSTGGDGPAGLLATIQITFSDGSTSTTSTDASWRATKTIPANFQSPSIDDSVSPWAAASVIAVYGSGPWLSQVVIPTSATPTLSITGSTWIWSAETSPPSAPAQPRAFRKTHISPSGKSAVSAEVLITVDDGFTLYVNGALVGSSPDELNSWQSAQEFTITNLTASSNLFAVLATNLPDATTGGDSPAGLLAAIQMTYSDGTNEVVLSDTTWLVDKTVPSGFELPSTDDSSWSNATSQGQYGVAPWGTSVAISDPLGEHPAPLMRKEFTLENKAVSHARLFYGVGGYASITINGALASDHVLTPGFTKYDTHLQYVVLDVASQLTPGSSGGDNVIGIELGRSHYAVLQGSVWNWNAAPWHGEPTVRALLIVGYADGTTQRIGTDTTWKVHDGPTRLDDVFGGENYDASFIIDGWDKPGFDASAWSIVQQTTGPKGTLVNQGQPPTRIVQTLNPTSITQIVPGTYVAAFERVVAGWARVTATGPAKTLITIHFGEKLNTDGSVIYQDTNHYYADNFQTDRFWLAGTGSPETFEPKFSYKGYQYVQVEGWPTGAPAPTTADILGRVVHDDIGTRGGFECSSDLLNQMHKAEVFTILNNAHSIPEDCPTFEKNGWSGDAMLGTEMSLTNLDSQGLLAKYVRDLDESLPIGTAGPPAVIAPDSGWGANQHDPTWHSAFIFIPWWLYQYRGDLRVLEDHYSNMKSYVQFELGRSPNNIATTGLGDWDTPETSPEGGNPPEDNRVSATAYLYQMLTIMDQIATLLGNTADATTFSTEASNVKSAFNGAFLNSTTGFYNGVGDSGYRQTHNLLALAFGLVPNNNTAQVVADSIADDVVARGNHLNTGALGTKILLPVLSDHGHVDTAFSLAQQTTFPSWGFWIANNATTMWEHWLVEARSHDHLFLGTFEDWLYKYVAGIRLTSPAFEEVSVAPAVTAQLSSASAWTLTPFGNLTVDWTNGSGSLVINVGVPVGVKATVTIPATGAQQISENGDALASSEGVSILGATGGTVQVAVGSGTYSFTVAKS